MVNSAESEKNFLWLTAKFDYQGGNEAFVYEEMKMNITATTVTCGPGLELRGPAVESRRQQLAGQKCTVGDGAAGR